MKPKRTAPPRRRISFAVDRDEIEINSDWVDAVMTTSPVVSPPPPSPAPPAVFFAPEENTATVSENSPGEECTSVEIAAPVDYSASVKEFAPVEDSSAVVDLTTEEICTTVAVLSPVLDGGSGEGNTTVDESAPVANSATGAMQRASKPRPIVRITDGLTPGQYAVYSLMFEAGEGTADGARVYKGGYADLGRLTGLSKRGLQNIVGELQAKHVIRMHTQPGYHRTQTSAYLVPPADAVVALWFSRGWRHALGKSKTLTG